MHLPGHGQGLVKTETLTTPESDLIGLFRRDEGRPCLEALFLAGNSW